MPRVPEVPPMLWQAMVVARPASVPSTEWTRELRAAI